MSISHITQNQRQDSPHPYHIQYSPQCVCPGCQNKTYWDGKVHYSCCLGCLQKKKLGPFKVRVHKENDYATLIWLSDWENAIKEKETLQ